MLHQPSGELDDLLSRARELEGRIVELQETIAAMRHEFDSVVAARHRQLDQLVGASAGCLP